MILSYDEIEILEDFRKLDEEQQQFLIEIIKKLAEQSIKDLSQKH